MANISDAHGSFTISANNKETILNFLNLMEYLDTRSGDYGTYFVNHHDLLNNYEEKIYRGLDDKFEIEIDFAGSGRWSYFNNIKNMMAWIKQDIEYYGNKKDPIIMQELEKEDYSIIFDYVDYEPGCEIFGNYVVEVVHKAGRPFTTIEIHEGDYQDYDMNNIVEFANVMDMTFADALDERILHGDYLEDLDESDAENLQELIADQKEEIELYFKDTLENLMRFAQKEEE